MKKLLCLTLLVLLVVAVQVQAEASRRDSADVSEVLSPETLRAIHKVIYDKFNPIEYFGYIVVYFQGSAEEIGLNKTELIDHARLRFKNNFAGIKCKQDLNIRICLPKALPNVDDWPKVGTISFTIWTVGKDFPIAYHISCEAGTVLNTGMWESAFLGYGSKANIPKLAKECIDDLIEDLAIDFFEVREEL